MWNVLQLVPAFVLAYLSDRTNRKNVLIFSQLIGLVGGIVLYIFGSTPWVLILIAITFNPTHVARAALLDIFPHYSTLKLVAITFFALNLPWMFFKEFSAFDFNFLVILTFVLLAVNSLLTFLFFHDRQKCGYSKVQFAKSIELLRNDRRIFYTLSAFICSEITFYLISIYIEYSKGTEVWLDITTFATLIGILIAMLYNRLPHMSMVTLFYSMGFGLIVVAILSSFLSISSLQISLLSSMSHYAVIGGMYLPFVTDAVIKMLGNRNKGIGSALIEGGDAIAILIAMIFSTAFVLSALWIFGIILVLFLLATGIQKKAEKIRLEIVFHEHK